ncbi:uncharacterized protein KD926_006915 [Aspergillus affinis]|uniref:uncharacterized protein n=1 Tax=Aspergillus affinis TaxID=1070780 RepID=UPI0022FEE873|nr:uncharacterized protein KD926_006915 [Aspergillus affinis]KAI9041339.1 hypothetical protein KD926_006915 [Aspergillus affinis]
MECIAVLKNPKGRLLISLGALITLLASSRLDYSPTCPSGNCTWSSFQSAGWCSKCADVTADAELVGCTEVDVDISSSKSQLTSCHVKLPHGSRSKSPIEVRPNHEISYLYQYKMHVPKDVIWAARGEEVLKESIENDHHEFLGVRNPLIVLEHAELDFNVIMAEDTALPNPEEYLYVKKATECVISMCSRTYNVSVSEGAPSLNVSAISYGESFLHKVDYGKYEGLDNITSDMTCWRGTINDTLDLEEITFNNTVGNTWAFGLALKDSDQFAFCPLDKTRSSLLKLSKEEQIIRSTAVT